MAHILISGEPYPRFICEVCKRESEPLSSDELLAQGWREAGFQTYVCGPCAGKGRVARS